jgi:hypothetical protein
MAMHRYIVERNIPGIESFTEEQLRAAAVGSCDAQRAIGPDVQWIESFVSDGKLYCHYNAASEEVLREHGRRMGLPVDRVSRVYAKVDPTMATGPATSTA